VTLVVLLVLLVLLVLQEAQAVQQVQPEHKVILATQALLVTLGPQVPLAPKEIQVLQGQLVLTDMTEPLVPQVQ
jgi:hypothetical protein